MARARSKGYGVVEAGGGQNVEENHFRYGGQRDDDGLWSRKDEMWQKLQGMQKVVWFFGRMKGLGAKWKYRF